ncbi:hypothetical protein [Deinococcus soli (ex Cha et al. 2016)]|uniref:Uncharacterized protein n=2 Tax=Deinococcus soli (ex Cha et al. 2016) TaxID=1309411 RepID=A0ACC6KHB6_9DEIO|nr:hypothetical protein [Deinococcus soli (ex Cha et al. 2016)]MDR6218877.1 hypothetical protein [Deinococcus soli (ex Cha et al. 2016)]MDR6328674.1 hypothetical protein [Deinococcus soli (ex Cha et al. 2016)]MDR6751839.1 hypothetical protein [Deinococcus soli (ex Cha et al. 2016)]
MTEPTGLYPLLTDTTAIYDHWTPIVSGQAEPDPVRARLIASVQRALDAGFTYDTHVDQAARHDLADLLTPELLARNNPDGVGVRGGLFGYEVYFARKVIEERAARERRDAAHARLAPEAGRNYGTLYIQRKRMTGCTVTSISGTALSFTGKRGSVTYTFSLTAEQLEGLLRDAQVRKAQAAAKRTRAA